MTRTTQKPGDVFGDLSPKGLSRRYRKAIRHAFGPTVGHVKPGVFHVVEGAGNVVMPEQIDPRGGTYTCVPGPIPEEPVELSWVKEAGNTGWYYSQPPGYSIRPNGKTGRFILAGPGGKDLFRGSLRGCKVQAQEDVSSGVKLPL